MKKSFILFSAIGLLYCSKESGESVSNENALSAEDKAAALKIHNDARADVGVAALTWSDALAADAAAWAQNMAEKEKMYHSGNAERPGQGENLYYTTATDTERSGRNASKAWYDEIQLYTYAPIGSGENNFAAIGHYTQMVWKSTTEVGMALAVSKSGATYVVARYSPPGNWQGETPY
ncbi:MAG: CAP family protein [Flavobacteriaceae bacterium]